ncbi:MAG TPA: helix-turn-helix transcriptional regulator [Solirubrobacteraceae bacterium]|nr:helix-turn-helix transcriptional regulator [Solirubrobacteraceae bacterium]
MAIDTASLLRDARHRAQLTQEDVANRARTAQSAVAAYETGARKPSLATLERLLAACDHDADLVARPRMRRGAAPLANLATTIRHDLAGGEEQNAIRLLFGFADDFRGSSRPGRSALIAAEPPATGDRRFDAALAATAEFFAAEGGIAVPDWVEGPDRFVEPWWFVTSRPAFHAYTLSHTPAVFARHGVFIAREVFTRA